MHGFCTLVDFNQREANFSKLGIDSDRRGGIISRLQMRHYLSWIEGLTTNQYVGGSNPSCRTTKSKGPIIGPFLLLREALVPALSQLARFGL